MAKNTESHNGNGTTPHSTSAEPNWQQESKKLRVEINTLRGGLAKHPWGTEGRAILDEQIREARAKLRKVERQLRRDWLVFNARPPVSDESYREYSGLA